MDGGYSDIIYQEEGRREGRKERKKVGRKLYNKLVVFYYTCTAAKNINFSLTSDYVSDIDIKLWVVSFYIFET